MTSGDQIENGVSIKEILKVGLPTLLTTAFISAGIYAGAKLQDKPNKAPKPNPYGKIRVEADRSARVVKTAMLDGGSRLVLGQCVDGSLPAINKLRQRQNCVIESFKSNHPDPALVYERGQVMLPEEVIPPLQPLPYTSNR